MGRALLTAADDYEFEPAPDGSFAILMSGGALYRFDRSEGGWGPRQRIETGRRGLGRWRSSKAGAAPQKIAGVGPRKAIRK